jgi:hypothetical protein
MMDEVPDTCQILLLPWIGNLAMIEAVVGNLNKETPKLEGEKITECKMQFTKREDLVTLRLTAPWSYIPEKDKQILKKKPEYAAHLLNPELKEVKTNKWETTDTLLTGYVLVDKAVLQRTLGCSGNNGIFVTRLAQDIITKPNALWISRSENETDESYFARARKEANGAPMTWRRGGGNDLGYQCSNDEIQEKSWALWGVPAFNGPGLVEEWLEQQGWKLKSKPLPPRNRNGPWKIFGTCNEKQSAYAFQADFDGKIRRLSIVPWKTSRKIHEDVQPITTGPRWFCEHFAYDSVGPTQVIDATMPDSPTEDEANKSIEVKSPPKKKAKAAGLRGGQAGPEGTNLRTIELGGTGDRGWRSLAFQLAALNSGGGNLADSVMTKLPTLGKALRSQALYHLCETDKEWQASWAPDNAWDNITEGGPPAKDLKTFVSEVLHREHRWIFHYGLMAVAVIKKIHLVIWQYRGEDEDPWTKIAVISPDDTDKGKKKFPIVHLAKDKGHYMPLISDSTMKPNYDFLEGGRIWKSKGIQNRDQESKKVFRAAGDEEPPRTPSCKHAPSSPTIADLLKTPNSTPKSAKTDVASLLRPPATPISAKNEQNSNFSVKHHQDKTCSWHCPFCSFKTIESNSTRRSHEIRDHLGRCHPFEFKKAQQESSESQASNQLRHGLGIMKQVKPLEFVKIKKEDAGFSCPYCRLGTVHMPSNSTLRRKT